MRIHHLGLLVMLAGSIASASGCKIRHDSGAGNVSANPGGSAAFDAKGYVEGMWSSKVIPLVKRAPSDVATLLDAITKDPEAAGKKYGNRDGAGQSWTYLVEGQGTIKSVDLQSRHGVVVLEVSPDGGAATEVDLQVGPVIFGTALRDSLPFVAFGDFLNQIDYAEVSRALNDKATSSRPPLDLSNSVGKKLSFVGAAVAPTPGAALVVTPVVLSLDGDAP